MITYNLTASECDSICEEPQVITCTFLYVYDEEDVVDLIVTFKGAAVKSSLSLPSRLLDPAILDEGDKFGEVYDWSQTSDTLKLYLESHKYGVVDWVITESKNVRPLLLHGSCESR